jgi:hypothetical protein
MDQLIVCIDAAPFVRRMIALLCELETLPPATLTTDPLRWAGAVAARIDCGEMMAHNLMAVRPLPCTNA